MSGQADHTTHASLSQVLVDTISVQNFQSKLTTLAKVRAKADLGDWRKCFQDCAEINAMFYANG